MKNQTLGHIRAANLKSSDRLGRVCRLLQDGNWHGTWEIIHACEVCAVNTIIAELRENGLRIETQCKGAGRYEYRLTCLTIPTGPTSQTSQTSQTNGTKI